MYYVILYYNVYFLITTKTHNIPYTDTLPSPAAKETPKYQVI